MAFCPNCGAESAAGAKFCASCGTALAASCSSCGAELPDGAKFCPSCGTPRGAAAPPAAVPNAPPPRGALSIESRRTVTMLFCDVTGSTAMGERLDPESMRQVMSRYFDAIRECIERHGGTLEKFVGDAVMAAFGIPVIHEDDAMRAVRAAGEMKIALKALEAELDREWGVQIQARTGINTGEVVAGDISGGSTFATGDTVNVAARLEQACPPGDVYLGESTYRLVRDAVTVEPVDPLTLKGKSEPVPAYRLVDVTPDAPGLARRLESPIVGRETELAQLVSIFDRSVSERSCQLVTVSAPAGAGKSRLTKELVEAVADRATVLQGRCIPYGEGITYFPLAVMLRALCGLEDDVTRDEARARILARLDGIEEPELVCARLAGAIGLDDVLARPEEISWAVRRLLETLAAEQPVLVVFDDIHWAEPTFLNLIEYIATFSRGAPILVHCPARPELAESLPGWAGSLPNAHALVLEPLGDAACSLLIANLLGEDVSADIGERIVGAAEGNPLFVEEMLRMLIDDGLLRRQEGRWAIVDGLAVTIPPSIEALLSARLDRLEPRERGVLQRGAVIGRIFGWDAVAEISPPPERAHVGASLQTLMRKELIQPDGDSMGGEDAFRFSHILIRDAAYRGIPKETRSALHESFAGFLEARTGDRAAEYEEIIGYHLEQAYLQRLGLGPVTDAARAIRDRGRVRLESAGHRALLRGDLPAAVNLFERAVALSEPGDAERIEILSRQGSIVAQLGRLEEAEDLLTSALEQSEQLDDPAQAARVEVAREFVRLQRDPEGRSEAIVQLVDRVVPLFESAGDELGLARSLRLRSEVDRLVCRFGAEAEALEEALIHAEQTTDRREATEIRLWLCTSLIYGPTPVHGGIERIREMLELGRGIRWMEAAILGGLGYLEAMAGRPDDGRQLYARSRAIYEELGMSFALAARAIIPAGIEAMAGEHEAAEHELLAGYTALSEIGENELRSTVAATLAQTLYEVGRDDEAEGYADTSAEIAAEDDVFTQVLWRGARAKVIARRDGDPAAEEIARAAVSLAAPTDCLSLHGQALLDLAEVLSLLGRPSEAPGVVAAAIALLQQKGDVPALRRAAVLMGSPVADPAP
jgi:class 3 adenylate cyclase/tetratricopeptide (TPR) repeat protein